jgi:hypothetical protein
MAHFASLFSREAASKSRSPDSRNSAAPCLASLFKSADTAMQAQAAFRSVVISVSFVERPAANPDAFGLALMGTRGDGRSLHKGELIDAEQASSFAFLRWVHQWVQPFLLPKGPALDLIELQREFPLFKRIDAPHIVPIEVMRLAKTYRQAVRLCLMLARHRRPGLTLSDIAIECDLTRQHVTDYFHNDDRAQRKNLPAEDVRKVETFLGNSAISQWHAEAAMFTVLEVLQARRAA